MEIARLHDETGAMMVYVMLGQTEALTLTDRIVVLRFKHIDDAGGARI